MRPLFDAVKAINEVRRRFNRRNVIYVVTPESPDHLYDGHYEKIEMYPHHIAATIKGVLKSKRSLKRSERVYVFDYEFFGHQKRGVGMAVAELNPDASIIHVNQFSKEFGDGIRVPEDMDVPTSKDYFGRVSDGQDQEKKDNYLLYQRTLQDYMSEKYKQVR